MFKSMASLALLPLLACGPGQTVTSVGDASNDSVNHDVAAVDVAPDVGLADTENPEDQDSDVEKWIVESALCRACHWKEGEGLVCNALPADTACDDKNCCTADDKCVSCDPDTDVGCSDLAVRCEGSAIDCSDNQVCTTDSCQCVMGAAECVHEDSPDGSACDVDPADCTEGDYCLAGQCHLTPTIPVDDNNVCTADVCAQGVVVHNPLNEGQCSDGNQCTNDDHCVLGTCVGGPEVDCILPICAESVACLPVLGCVPTWRPEATPCDDGNPATSDDRCTADHECQGQTLILKELLVGDSFLPFGPGIKHSASFQLVETSAGSPDAKRLESDGFVLFGVITENNN